jgi:hypothetical protein
MKKRQNELPFPNSESNEFHLVPYARLDWLSFFLKVIAGAGECSGGVFSPNRLKRCVGFFGV